MDDISQDLRRDMESARLGQYFNEMLQRLDKLGQEDPVLYMFLWMLIGLRSQVNEMARDFYRKNSNPHGEDFKVSEELASQIVASWPEWKRTLFTDRSPVNTINPPKEQK